jgi:hypothetical protein
MEGCTFGALVEKPLRMMPDIIVDNLIIFLRIGKYMV